MKQYVDLLNDVLDNGFHRQDRTGVGTIGVFGRQVRFNLREGFPLVTVKKTHFRSVVLELLWFLRGETNIKTLGCSIWDEWRRPYNENRPVVSISPLCKEYVGYEGDFSAAGTLANNDDDRMLLGVWLRMMRRCYDITYHNYKNYGGVGVSVAKEWHYPRQFIEDAKGLPHWEYKKADNTSFDLDKDYFGARQYGPETSVWLHESENCLYTASARPVSITTDIGWKAQYLSVAQAARYYNIPTSSIHRFLEAKTPTGLKSNNKQFEGWTFEYVEPSGKLLRLKLIEPGEMGPIYGYQWRNWNGNVDQIAKLIYALKTNPLSRRHMVTAWNPSDVDDMALPPCHVLTQYYVDNHGCLSCHLYQRSADLFLGVPFNIASYALLTHMIARVCGLGVGELVISFGDLHLYSNHLEQARMVASREPMPLPTISLARKDNINDFQLGDVTLRNYVSWPAVKGEVAV